MVAEIRRSSWKKDRATPIVSTHGAVQGIAGGNDARNGAQSGLQFAVGTRQLIRGETVKCFTDVYDIAMIDLEAEVLLLQLAQALREQDGAGNQHERERSLTHHQQLLRERSSLGGGAIASAQGLDGIAVRADPGGNHAKHDARQQRQKERE